MCRWCSYHFLTSFVIYYWTDARQHRIYLFYIITTQTTTDKASFISKSFNITRKPAFAHFGEHEKKPFGRDLEAISLVTMRRKQVVDSHGSHLIAPFPLGQGCPDVLFHVVIAVGLFFPTIQFWTWLYPTYQGVFKATETQASQFMNNNVKFVKAWDGTSSNNAEAFERTGEFFTVPLVKS